MTKRRSSNTNETNLKPINIAVGEVFSETPLLEKLSSSQFKIDLWILQKEKDGSSSIRVISRKGFLKLLHVKGFRKIYHNNGVYTLVQQIGNILWNREVAQIKDFLISYIQSNYPNGIDHEDDGIEIKIPLNQLEEIWLRQQHMVTNLQFLGYLQNVDPDEILRDTRDTSFILFKNVVIKSTAARWSILDYCEVDGLVWADHIIDRDFYSPEDFEKCEFDKFVSNISEGDEKRIYSVRSALGYLLHNYSHPSKGVAIFAYDQEISESDQPEGGTGKGLLIQAFKQLRKVTPIDGKKFDANDKFAFQSVDHRTQIIAIDDVRASQGFVDRFNSTLTEGLTVEKKHKPSFVIPVERMPKIYFTSNIILDNEGNTRKRRQHIIEFSPYYSNLNRQGVKEPVLHVHGGRFFDNDDWNDSEWDRFYAYMIESLVLYLKQGLQQAKLVGVFQNRLLQTTSGEFTAYINNSYLPTNKWIETKEEYREFVRTYIGDFSVLKQLTFTKWLKKYCAIMGYKLIVKRSNNRQFFKLELNHSNGRASDTSGPTKRRIRGGRSKNLRGK